MASDQLPVIIGQKEPAIQVRPRQHTRKPAISSRFLVTQKLDRHNQARYAPTNPPKSQHQTRLNAGSCSNVPRTPTHKQHRAVEFIKFLDAVNANVPADLDVHVVMDNASTHKTPAVHKWQLRHPRFVFHFTPTSSSWLNLVERWFGHLTDKKLRRSAHHSVKELTADLESWVKAWNENPKPFVWTKTADQILAKLKRYLTDMQQTSDSGH